VVVKIGDVFPSEDE